MWYTRKVAILMGNVMNNHLKLGYPIFKQIHVELWSKKCILQYEINQQVQPIVAETPFNIPSFILINPIHGIVLLPCVAEGK